MQAMRLVDSNRTLSLHLDTMPDDRLESLCLGNPSGDFILGREYMSVPASATRIDQSDVVSPAVGRPPLNGLRFEDIAEDITGFAAFETHGAGWEWQMGAGRVDLRRVWSRRADVAGGRGVATASTAAALHVAPPSSPRATSTTSCLCLSTWL
jgi:hypothetical protein